MSLSFSIASITLIIIVVITTIVLLVYKTHQIRELEDDIRVAYIKEEMLKYALEKAREKIEKKLKKVTKLKSKICIY